MPNETKNYGTVITTAGAALIAKCILNGGKVNIKTAAAGDGGVVCRLARMGGALCCAARYDPV